ncbi:MAG: acyl-CoA dehydrogenase [Alphaproteobacteria bacterium]|nr:MAG: acyl-CoA dehydrogenase [Alphaproteobacteria bacterium]
MTAYTAPLKDIRFALDHIIDYGELVALDRFSEATPDVVDAILSEGAKFVSGVIDPLRRSGDQQGSVLENGTVRTPDGFREAYRQYVDGGWNGLAADPDYGGQGLPFVLACVFSEMFASANVAFSLCPLLGQGAVEAISSHGTEDQKALYLEKLITGKWSGAMCLTEPQAGSDVGALKTKAEPVGDGTYRISGQKIFITYGDHDMAENVIHLVLARLPDAPAGTKGISLFIVPKILVNDDGSLGARNDMRVVSLEHKLGIHASPTCVMSYGDDGNCVGYLIGEENRGMRYMFTMMNHARLGVGIQGLALSELAFQQAYAYAMERVQGRPIGTDGAPIIEHADVRRMLLRIKSQTEAARALCYLNAKAIDMAHAAADKEDRWWAQGLADLLTPLSKAWCTDLGVESASLAVQVHGGMGYIEETGVAQTLRDARIAPIYEGTNGIQALDLVGRKLAQDGGEHWKVLFMRIERLVSELPNEGDLGVIGRALQDALTTLKHATDWMMAERDRNMRAVAAGATDYLRLFALTVGGYLLAVGARSADHYLRSRGDDAAYYQARLSMARFFAEQVLPESRSLGARVTCGDETLFAVRADALAS